MSEKKSIENNVYATSVSTMAEKPSAFAHGSFPFLSQSHQVFVDTSIKANVPFTTDMAGLDAAYALKTDPNWGDEFLPSPIISKQRIGIAYNPYSVDSLMAAALALHLPTMRNARCVAYSPFGTMASFLDFDYILFVGVEITKLDFLAYMNGSEGFLDLVCYRDSYNWMSEKERKTFKHRMQLRYPTSEMFSELTSRTDNTAVKSVQFMLENLGQGLPPGALLSMVDLVARFVSHSYPIMGMEVDFNSPNPDGETELQNKARIHDMVPKLRHAIHAFDPKEALKAMVCKPDVTAYLAHFRHVRYALSRSLTIRTFGRGPKAITMPVSPASELLHNDILHAALQLYPQVMTYEDVGDYRLWRIYANKVYERNAIANVLKPIMTWSEGVVLCAVTTLTNYNL